ncbi:3-deoxy-manno-octulosonate cytidylyltransferase [Neisseria leonii]|uniref:3-deoxy-manno-octulosonate cytidylyltransferase n=1 Tax=Neisseria leonii TaxID=2995413 RepID=A0A9X4IAJ4_9NEIS|nr:3-deoxy-manno-octulosonate cytidylyltransferase [Neisseria sp. 51.81]MDD9327429.1 3-deoxy-manno-octulosonate cytidylyltransferase [Neisseria sp. 51.81]
MTDFVVLVPARLSSSRLPHKALADIGGKPMVVRSAEQAAKSRASRVAVATDHEAIAAACREHGIEVVMTDARHENGTLRLAEAVDILALPDDTAVVNVQGDEPMMDPELINRTAAALAAGTSPMATAAHEIRCFDDFLSPDVVKTVLNSRNQALYFSRAPIAYPRDTLRAGRREWAAGQMPLRHIGLYAYYAGFLRGYPKLAASPLEQTESLEQLRVLWHGYTIAVHIADSAPAAGVDTQEDLERVRALFAAQE